MIDLLNEQAGPGPDDLEALDDIDEVDPDLDSEGDLNLDGDLGEINDFDNDDDFVPPDEDGYYDSSIEDIDDFERPQRRKPARKPARARKPKKKKKKPVEDTQATWQRLCGNTSEGGQPYNITQAYKPQELLRHPKFGLGYVREVCSQTKIEVIFEDGPRRLVCNMKD